MAAIQLASDRYMHFRKSEREGQKRSERAHTGDEKRARPEVPFVSNGVYGISLIVRFQTNDPDRGGFSEYLLRSTNSDPTIMRANAMSVILISHTSLSF
jgi:hypothetical protein